MLSRYSLLFALLFALSGVIWGCGSKESSSPGPHLMEEEPDDQDPEEPEEPEEPVVPEVFLPAHIQVQVTPARAVYTLGLQVTPRVTVYGYDGEPNPRAAFDVRASPEAAATQDGTRWVIEQEGPIVFTACTVDNGVDGEPLCASDRIYVDDGPPLIEIHSPQPGAELDATSSPTIIVEGRVTDSNRQPYLFINGASVEYDEEGEFVYELTPRFGVNTIYAEATDGVNVLTREVVLDVMWATEYAAVPEDEISTAFAQGIVLRLGQNFLDDGLSPVEGADGSLMTRDLADILELVLRYIDLQSQVPDPVVASDGLTLRVTDIDIGPTIVQIELTTEGLDIFVGIPGLIAQTEGLLAFGDANLPLDGEIEAGLSALLQVTVTKNDLNSPLQIDVEDLAVSIDTTQSRFDADEANAVFTLAQSVLRNTLEDLFRSAVNDALLDQLPAILESTLGALDNILEGQTFELDTGLGDPLVIELDGGIASVTTTYRTALQADMMAAARILGAVPVHAHTRGIPSIPASVPDAFFQSGRLQLGLQLDFINGLLHGAWNAGLLSLDVSDLLGVNADRAFVTGKLAPVIAPAQGNRISDLVIQLGQIELEVEFDRFKDVYGIGAEVGVEFVLENNEIVIRFDDEPTIRTWIISSEGNSLLNKDTLAALVRTQVWPQLTQAIGGGLTLPLPAPDLGGLTSVAPELANFTLSFEVERRVAVRGGYAVVDAVLEGVVGP